MRCSSGRTSRRSSQRRTASTTATSARGSSTLVSARPPFLGLTRGAVEMEGVGGEGWCCDNLPGGWALIVKVEQ
eukprot:1104887-Rhodomonas_salina.1